MGHDFTSATVFKAIISSSKVNVQQQEPKLSRSRWNNTEREGANNNFYHHRRVETCYINSISLTMFHVICGNFYFSKWPSSILPKPVCLDLSSLISVPAQIGLCRSQLSNKSVPVQTGLSGSQLINKSGAVPFLPKPVCPEKPVLTQHHAARAPFWINVAQLSRLDH